MTSVRTGRWSILTVACLALQVLACLPTCSVAWPSSRLFFGSFGYGDGQLNEPSGIATDERSGDVYVVDTNNHRVEEFTAAGTFIRTWGSGVDNGRTRSPQTCSRQCFVGLDGEGAGAFGFAEGAAVDNDPRSPDYRDVFVTDIGNHRILKFSASGHFLLTFGDNVNVSALRSGLGAFANICPAHPGDICQAGTGGPEPGQFEFPVEGHPIAIGPDGRVYVGDRNCIERYSPDGRFLSRINLYPTIAGGGELGGVSELAVNAHEDFFTVRIGAFGLDEYVSSGHYLRTFDVHSTPNNGEGPTSSFALGQDGQLFINEYAHERHRIVEYEGGSNVATVFDEGMEDGLHGLAYDSRARRLYVIDTNGNTSPPIAHVRIIVPPWRLASLEATAFQSLLLMPIPQ
jgi:tripartite motif-containing protein 71